MKMTTATLSRWPMIVGPLATLWYGFGFYQMYSGYVANAASAPIWAWIGFSVATLAGIAGSILLFINNETATKAFAASIVGALIYYFGLYVFGIPTPGEEPIAVVIVGVTVALFVVCKKRFV